MTGEAKMEVRATNLPKPKKKFFHKNSKSWEKLKNIIRNDLNPIDLTLAYCVAYKEQKEKENLTEDFNLVIDYLESLNWHRNITWRVCLFPNLYDKEEINRFLSHNEATLKRLLDQKQIYALPGYDNGDDLVIPDYSLEEEFKAIWNDREKRFQAYYQAYYEKCEDLRREDMDRYIRNNPDVDVAEAKKNYFKKNIFSMTKMSELKSKGNPSFILYHHEFYELQKDIMGTNAKLPQLLLKPNSLYHLRYECIEPQLHLDNKNTLANKYDANEEINELWLAYSDLINKPIAHPKRGLKKPNQIQAKSVEIQPSEKLEPLKILSKNMEDPVWAAAFVLNYEQMYEEKKKQEAEQQNKAQNKAKALLQLECMEREMREEEERREAKRRNKARSASFSSSQLLFLQPHSLRKAKSFTEEDENPQDRDSAAISTRDEWKVMSSQHHPN